MEPITISYNDLNGLSATAKKILGAVPAESRVFAFYGSMGAGKTTLIKEICRKLGSRDSFSSPTYSIVNEYLIDTEKKIYHLDLYRLNHIEEALSIGIDDYLHSGNYVFIEWPGLIEPLLPPETVKIDMRVHENMRELSIFMGEIRGVNGGKEERF